MLYKIVLYAIMIGLLLIISEPSFTTMKIPSKSGNFDSNPDCIWANRADSGLDIDTGDIRIPSGYSERHQFVHPDWIYFAELWGPEEGELIIGINSFGDIDTIYTVAGTLKWPYWMVCNALPGGNGDYENPYIRVSWDKTYWIRPFAIGIDSTPAMQSDTVWVRDPIFDSTFFNNYPGCSVAYFSDVELAGYNGCEDLWCVFRLINLGNDNLRRGIIGLPSSNGITWRIYDTTYLITDSGTSINEKKVEMMSPTINRNTESIWEMWFVDKTTSEVGQGDSTLVIKLTCPKLDTLWWSSYQSEFAGTYETCQVVPPSDSVGIWHIHVIQHPLGGIQRYMLATVTEGDYSTATFGQYFYISDSIGLDWNLINEVIPCSYPDTTAWDYCTYRGSFIFEETGSGWCLPTLYSGFNYRSNPDSIIYQIGYTVIYTNCCGDVYTDGEIDIFDITFIIAYLYLTGPPPDPLKSADVNHDGTANIFDITYLISYLYMGGPDPACL
jgi:hypothetical protein